MAPSVAAGSVVTGFRVESTLSEGSMASVYVAEEIATGRRVALKVLAPELARDERFRRRFLRESEVASSLHHPNVVETVGAGEDPEHGLYLATAYVEGSDLRTLLRRDGPFEPSRAVALVEQIASALDAAHAAGLVHRDVKPANVLVAADAEGEHAYVCDFGLARHVSSVSSLTGDRGFVGTIDYVPPEQIEGGQIDARTDVYSLGCLLFELLTGSKPFDRDSELSVVFAHLNEPPPSATELRSELPDAFDDVFRTALAKSPSDRYGSCGELARAARAALTGRKMSPRRRRRPFVVAAAVAVVAAAAIAVGVIESSSSGKPSAATEITQTSIGGITLGHDRRWYTRKLGPGTAALLTQSHIRKVSYEGPEFGVYFPPKGQGTRANIITVWNKSFRTPEGIGPCSTVAQMHQVYGKLAHANWSGTSPDGKTHFSWQLGRNLLFITPNQRTIASVVLFKGLPHEHHGNSPRDDANYVGQNEAQCK